MAKAERTQADLAPAILAQRAGQDAQARAISGKIAGRAGWIAALAAGLALSGCSTPEVFLTGKRLSPRAIMTDQIPSDTDQKPANRSLPITIPAQVNNAEWRQGEGTPSTRTTNAALSANPTLVWSASIGKGDSRKAQITGDPVVAAGRIYTMDSEGTVTATSTAGATLWHASIVPHGEAPIQGSGGALAYGDGKLFVTSGFGTLTALDPATGNQIWQQKLLAAATGAPTVLGKLVYVTAGEDEAWALTTDDGRVQWQVSANPDVNNFSGAPSPAVTDQYAVFGFGSGDIQGVFRRGGLRQWSVPVNGRRPGFARTVLSDITGDPVIVGDTVYAGNQSGRTVALGLADGKRLWTADEGPMNPAWVFGGSVFITNDLNELVRLDARNGDRIWGTQLPYFTESNPKKLRAIYAQFGPVLAGSQLIVASSGGKLRFFNPVNGHITNTIDMPSGAASGPVVAGRTLYVVTKDGHLLAYR